ncbi:hypothetical protein AAMO2058_000886400 [Amorphochlora amoebiformis]
MSEMGPGSVLIACFIVAATTYVIFRWSRANKKRGGGDEDESWPFPELDDHGLFTHTRAENSKLEECKSDFCRIAWTKTDLLVSTPEAPMPEVWKWWQLDGAPKEEEAPHKEISDKMFKHLGRWLRNEMKGTGSEAATDLTAKIVDLISVTPAVTFALEHKVPMQFLQTKFILLISAKGEVRVLWLAFMTDKVKPGAKSGPFVLKLLSSNLNDKGDQKGEKECILSYSAKRTLETQICAVTSQGNSHISKAILEDEWTSLECW